MTDERMKVHITSHHITQDSLHIHINTGLFRPGYRWCRAFSIFCIRTQSAANQVQLTHIDRDRTTPTLVRAQLEPSLFIYLHFDITDLKLLSTVPLYIELRAQLAEDDDTYQVSL